MSKLHALEIQVAELQARVRLLEAGVGVDDVSRAIASNSTNTIVVLDREAMITYISRPPLDFTPEDLLGVNVYGLLDGDNALAMKNAVGRVAETLSPDEFSTSYISPSGQQSWWKSTVGPIEKRGELVGFVVVATNVTSQCGGTAAQERFFDLSVDIMCVAGFDGYFKRLNESFRATLGYGEELLEQPYLDFVHPDDVEATREVVARIIGGENVVEFVNRYRNKAGDYRWFSWRGAPDSTRKVIYAVARDVTEARLRNEQLQQSQKMEAIGQLAGGISHDFNNLLLAIGGNIELALEEPEHAEAPLSDAILACQRAASLTRQLLLFSRDQVLSPTLLDVNSLLTDIMTLLERLLPENITVSVRHWETCPPVLADQTQLEQVVINLCLNARDAMQGGGRLQLEIDSVAIEEASSRAASVPAGRYVTINVKDTGTGIPSSVRSRIFEPFFTTKGVGKGTGLGLATVYGIVQKHQGFLEVDSALGEGTCFRVYLPAASESRLPVHSLSLPELPAEGGRETLLLAEDDPMVRRVVQRILSQAGYTVLVANDGLEAVGLFRLNCNEIALVLLDVVMPRVGGVEAAQQMRKENGQLPVVFASGYVQDSHTHGLLRNEVVLSKPYNRENLLRTVRLRLDAQVVAATPD